MILTFSFLLVFGVSTLSFCFLLLLARGLLAFGAGFPLLAPFHAHASLLAFASRHNTPVLLFIEGII
jgi:hypothetical protein